VPDELRVASARCLVGDIQIVYLRKTLYYLFFR
jgi:hypothetical protein